VTHCHVGTTVKLLSIASVRKSQPENSFFLGPPAILTCMNSPLSKLVISTCVLIGNLEKRRPAQRTGAGDGLTLRHKLNEIKTLVSEYLKTNDIENLHVKTGSGNGYVAKVPWIFISRDAGPVATKIGVAICFGRGGNGIVIGKMYPIGINRGQAVRSIYRATEDFIDVDGDSKNTHYNDRFISPSEFTIFSENICNIESTLISKIRML